MAAGKSPGDHAFYVLLWCLCFCMWRSADDSAKHPACHAAAKDRQELIQFRQCSAVEQNGKQKKQQDINESADQPPEEPAGTSRFSGNESAEHAGGNIHDVNNGVRLALAQIQLV